MVLPISVPLKPVGPVEKVSLNSKILFKETIPLLLETMLQITL
jgi:hypothetical protein